MGVPDPSFRERKSKFIRKFTKTPKGIVCPHFYLVSWANGCPYQCAWCFLQLTFKGHVEPQIFSNVSDLEKELKAHQKRPECTVLNFGELSDGLWKEETVGLVDMVVPIMRKQDRHKAMFLTKSTNIYSFLKHEPTPQVIISFSVNAITIADTYEKGAPHVLARLEAARELSEIGWPVRLRIDPMVPQYDVQKKVALWETWYKELIDVIFEMFYPERITLGSLRYWASLPSWAKKKGRVTHFTQYPMEKDGSDNRLRVTSQERLKMYLFAIDRINYWNKVEEDRVHNEDEGFPRRTDVSVCKETVEMWKQLPIKGCICNCRW